MRHQRQMECAACVASPLHVSTDTVYLAAWTIEYDDALDRHFTERVCDDHVGFIRRHYKNVQVRQ